MPTQDRFSFFNVVYLLEKSRIVWNSAQSCCPLSFGSSWFWIILPWGWRYVHIMYDFLCLFLIESSSKSYSFKASSCRWSHCVHGRILERWEWWVTLSRGCPGMTSSSTACLVTGAVGKKSASGLFPVRLDVRTWACCSVSLGWCPHARGCHRSSKGALLFCFPAPTGWIVVVFKVFGRWRSILSSKNEVIWKIN